MYICVFFVSVSKMFLSYFGSVLTVSYFGSVLTVSYFRSVLTVWYFGSVLTVSYFRSVLTVVFFVFHFIRAILGLDQRTIICSYEIQIQTKYLLMLYSRTTRGKHDENGFNQREQETEWIGSFKCKIHSRRNY